MKDLVIVKSKTIDNESVPVVFNTVTKTFGGVKDERELSRSYIFENFEAKIPLKLAKILVKQNPNEFSITESVEEVPSEAVKTVLNREEARAEGFVCEYCDFEARSRAGLKSHIRNSHPDKWEGKKPTKKSKKKEE